jgi:hypothetical protein
MAREAIIEKLNRALQEERFSEPLAVYVLVEIRKYLEQQKLLRRYPILNFFLLGGSFEGKRRWR